MNSKAAPEHFWLWFFPGIPTSEHLPSPSSRLAAQHFPHAFDDPRAFLRSHAGAGGEAKSCREESIADTAAMVFDALEDRLEMQGLPDRAAFDVLRFQRLAQLLGRDLGPRGIQGEAGEPVGGTTPRRFGLELDRREIREGLGVGREVSAARGHLGVQRLQLAQSDGGEDVAEAVVIAEDGVLVMGRGITRLGREVAGLLGKILIIGDKHAAPGGGDDLVAVEGVDAGPAERARSPVAIGGAQGLGGVLDEGDAMTVTAGADRGDVRGLTVKVDKDDGLELLAGPDFLFDDLAGQGGVHVPALLLGIDEDRGGADVGDGRS